MGNVIVIGAGAMGSGIAQTVAQAGYSVYLTDKNKNALESGLDSIRKGLELLEKKGNITEQEKNDTLGRITLLEDMKGIVEPVLIIEAIVENMAVKKALWQELSPLIGPSTYLASNTSSLSITEQAVSTSNPDKFIGLHFFNPVPKMELVEIITGASTSEDTFQWAKEFVKSLGKTGVVVKESPGFVFNRLIIPMINEAIKLYADGIAGAADIDATLKLGASHPIGPLALADFIGLDVVLDIMTYLAKELGEAKYSPAPLLREMVKDGLLGRKTGKGFFDY
ncbi:MAG: 3-hydroxyacyl-CoA dehydrogenase NAD-binding domain-containing protein [Peptococcia bacterium]